jgi:L-ribulose-5-phosphate 3-epimerase
MNSSTRGFSRRTLLSRSAQAAVGLTFGSRLAPLLAAPASRWFKIGACDWSLGKEDPSSFDVAKAIGLDGVQVSMGRASNDMHLRKKDVQKAFLDAAHRTGLEIGSLALGELNNVPLKSDPRAAEWLLDSVAVCKALGVKVCMPAFFGAGDLDPADKPSMDRVIGVLKKAGALAEKAGIVIGIENYLSAEDNLKILDRVGSPAVAVYYDVGNSTDKGRDILKEIRLLGKNICEFHAKDGGDRLGKGRIDFRKVRKAIDDIGFSGWIQLETPAPKGVLVDYKTDLAYLRDCFRVR